LGGAGTRGTRTAVYPAMAAGGTAGTGAAPGGGGGAGAEGGRLECLTKGLPFHGDRNHLTGGRAGQSRPVQSPGGPTRYTGLPARFPGRQMGRFRTPTGAGRTWRRGRKPKLRRRRVRLHHTCRRHVVPMDRVAGGAFPRGTDVGGPGVGARPSLRLLVEREARIPGKHIKRPGRPPRFRIGFTGRSWFLGPNISGREPGSEVLEETSRRPNRSRPQRPMPPLQRASSPAGGHDLLQGSPRDPQPAPGQGVAPRSARTSTPAAEALK